MRKELSKNPIMWALLVALVAPLLLCAQEKASRPQPRYRLIDLGTLGGPNSFFAELNNDLNTHRALATS